MTKNKESTRYYSHAQEQSVATLLDGQLTSNSGAAKFSCGDVIQKNASLLIECKTCLTDKDSFSIKKDWITKIQQECKDARLENSCVCFNFGPNQPNYFIIPEKLMKFLVECLEKEVEN